MARTGTAKHWVFTLNDADDQLEHTDVCEIWGPHCDYLVFQEEVGSQGTKHYQGYAEFNKRVRPAGLTKHFKPHWEKRKGTRDQARDYCMKAETRKAGPWELGVWSSKSQGKRTDLMEVCEAIKEGKTQKEIFEEFPSATIRYYSNIEKCRNLFRPVRTEDLEVTLAYGKPGTGKTHRFWENAPDGWDIPVGKDLWFTGYNGEANVLIDDFSGNISLVSLLRILDKYPVSCPTKGSHVWWCPKQIYITTNVHPKDWYDYSARAESYEALKRRFTYVLHFKKENGEYLQEQVDVNKFFD